MSGYAVELSPDFVGKVVRDVKPHWGPLGWITYKRTYARFLEDEKRTETWPETVKRVVEGNVNLDPRLEKGDEKAKAEMQEEAKKLFSLIYSLSATPSGRNLWVSGTRYQRMHGDSLNNCWFISMKPQPYGQSKVLPPYLSPDQKAVSMPFAFTFDELMKGGGVGFSVTRDNISKMPPVERPVNLKVFIDSANRSFEEAKEAGAIPLSQKEEREGEETLRVPDSREGWVEALAYLVDSHFSYGPSPILSIDVSDLRARGERIKGFGGTASGAGPLVEMLLDANKILNEAVGRRLSSVDATDIGNLIGKAVVAGNVRRSAELALGDWDDEAFRKMKQDPEKLMHHRWASNNSVVTNGKKEQFREVAKEVVINGEPGVVDLELSRNFGRLVDGFNPEADPLAMGTNPCGEITLEDGEPCNLFEIFPAIAEENGWDLGEVAALAARFAKRVTFGSYDWQISRNAIERNRRLGVSLSGIQDWFLSRFGSRAVIGWEDGKPVYNEKIAKALSDLYGSVKKADEEYSKALGCFPSRKLTTVKPSGTVAKLAGASEGMHFQWARHFIQRIRFQDQDPLVAVLKECGYKVEADIYNKHTMCVEFPVKPFGADLDTFASAGDVSASEQLATQAFLQRYWSDNAVSCTVTFRKEEEGSLPSILSAYAGKIKSTSLLQYVDGGYAQMPKEAIGEERYEAMQEAISADPEAAFGDAIEEAQLEIVGQSDCAGGACPVR